LLTGQHLTTVEVESAPIDRYRPLLDADLWERLQRSLQAEAEATSGRVVWNVNSTARGGGVAELLAALIPYERGAGIDARWVVIEGEEAFFALTKRLHNLLHGVAVDGGDMSGRERSVYERTLEENAAPLMRMIHPGDPVILQDPQTAGLAPALAEHGCAVIWRCHIGVDEPNEVARRAWDFLRPYVSSAAAVVFSRRAHVWEGLAKGRTAIIAPAIDAFAVKNQELDAETVRSILRAGGLLDPGQDGHSASFARPDGPTVAVRRKVKLLGDTRLPDDVPLVVQVSRWDPLKDPLGVLEGFAGQVAPNSDAHLVLAGPAVTAVADDPEQPEIVGGLEERWRRLEPGLRRRVHVAQLPMEDEDENAAMVNALQRQARVVVQKSLAEGFGLTVSEAMWKAKPVVASRVGGIEDQVEDGRSGVLLDDPHDLEAFGRTVTGLLTDPARAERLGQAARDRVCRHFLAPRHLEQQAELVRRVVGR
jgi:trehalose synthase